MPHRTADGCFFQIPYMAGWGGNLVVLLPNGTSAFRSDLGLLLLLALAKLVLHLLTNGQYGFHRDELATIDDARELAWGYVAYPPVTPALARVALMLPIAPSNSRLWPVTSRVHDNFREQIGWQEVVQTVATIYQALPVENQRRVAILTGNYGEAGAINLYGPAYGLPQAISGINSYWLRGYGTPPPEMLIVVGFSHNGAGRFFETCQLAGHITNRYGVANEETKDHPDIFVCRGLRQSWPTLWERLKGFG